MKKLMLLSIILISIGIICAQETVESILNNPGAKIGQKVTVEGFVDQWIDSQSGTNYYVLKGDYGGTIKVNSSSKPETGARYSVTGLVQKDAYSDAPLIAEISAAKIETNPQPQAPAPAPEPTPQPQQSNTNSTLLILALLGVVGIIVLIYFLTRKKSVTTSSFEQTSPSSSTPPPPPIPGVANPMSSTIIMNQPSEFKTIMFTRNDKTMRFIPGRFEIITDEDKGKTFMISGYPGPEGNEVTVGREEVKGERVNSHIRISDKFRTVSRQQAVIVESAGKICVVNKSNTNPTQINGKELAEGEKREIKFNDVIKMGELEFLYKQ